MTVPDPLSPASVSASPAQASPTPASPNPASPNPASPAPRLTPGAYLKHRRQAAMLSVADVAARIGSEPRTPEHLRVEWLALVEADAAPMMLATLVALRRVFPFDMGVLWMLEQIAQGSPLPPPQLCRVCACSDFDRCTMPHGVACGWVEDDLCSDCHDLLLAVRQPAPPVAASPAWRDLDPALQPPVTA